VIFQPGEGEFHFTVSLRSEILSFFRIDLAPTLECHLPGTTLRTFELPTKLCRKGYSLMVTNPLSPLATAIGSDIDAGTLDLESIKLMGILGLNRPPEAFGWITPQNLSRKTLGPNAIYEVVYHEENGTKRRIVCHGHDGSVDAILCVRKT
ncbi:hypothetical protein, partial [Actibacterium sp.]|uniref:hypothetical protein n=1 Tax=Actibacterium sp. TaxID=1872125 RepID=UPI00356900D5